MSDNKKTIYSKPLIFSIITFVVIMAGSIITALYPVMRADMHPVLENLEPYTPLQLAGRDIYQREGCSVCHTQTVRPLKSEVLRYGDYSKAGENFYERPFLWGSKRTGPDLSRIGNKYPDEWHHKHFVDPQHFYPKSNMPKYKWFETNKLNPSAVEAHMKGLGFPYTAEDIKKLDNVTELEAITAYMQKIGSAVEPFHLVEITTEDVEKYGNPVKGKPETMARGKAIFNTECAGCHGMKGEGDIGMTLAGYADSMNETIAFLAVANGYQGFMPGFANVMTMEQIASVIEYIRSLPAIDGE